MTQKTKAEKAPKPIKEAVVEKPVEKVVEQPKETKPSWVVKDRVYSLKDGLAPLTYTIKSSILTKKKDMKENLNTQQIKQQHLLMNLKE